MRSSKLKKKVAPHKQTPDQIARAGFRRTWKKFQREIAGLDFKRVKTIQIDRPVYQSVSPTGEWQNYLKGERTISITYVDK